MKLNEARKLSLLILKEYALDKGALFTSFSGKNNTSSSGKKADNIATGEAKPYKDNTYLTQYEQKLPHLAKLTQDLKNNQNINSLAVRGPALEELLILIKAKKPLKKDNKNQWILPMGDNIRLLKNGNEYLIKYITDNSIDKIKEDNPNTTEKHDKSLVPNLTKGLI